MTHNDTQTARVNRLGSPCPAWCVSEHTRLIVEEPEVYPDFHRSDYLVKPDQWDGPRVYATVSGYPGKPADPCVIITAGTGRMRVSALGDDAEDLAVLLEHVSGLFLLADQVRTAAEMGREAL